MKLYDLNTKEVLMESELRNKHLDKSIPTLLTPEILTEFGLVPVFPTPQPEVSIYQHAYISGVEQDTLGNWVDKWEVSTITDPDSIAFIDASIAATQRNAKKAQREANVKNILVTVNGKEFNGDEISQTRISRALIALEFAKQDSTKWILANNEEAIVTKAELAQVLILAGQKQTELWPI